MKKLFVFITLFGMSLAAMAQEMRVLAISADVSVEQIDRAELANIFLGKQTNWADGKHINIGYSLQPEEDVDAFLEQWVGKNHRRFKKFWVKKVFAGYGVAPKMFKTSKRALDFVRKHEGALVFVRIDSEDELEGLRVLQVDGKTSF